MAEILLVLFGCTLGVSSPSHPPVQPWALYFLKSNRWIQALAAILRPLMTGSACRSQNERQNRQNQHEIAPGVKRVQDKNTRFVHTCACKSWFRNRVKLTRVVLIKSTASRPHPKRSFLIWSWSRGQCVYKTKLPSMDFTQRAGATVPTAAVMCLHKVLRTALKISSFVGAV